MPREGVIVIRRGNTQVMGGFYIGDGGRVNHLPQRRPTVSRSGRNNLDRQAFDKKGDELIIEGTPPVFSHPIGAPPIGTSAE
jgi:hypothetical protein